ncbi:hypothetical protein BSY239_1549 [Hydrogenophaga sp. RAC07]|uniref:hypothetical protein n=1 Tax=Hydrogenophaga sp. RAC07 TaxID=1842537 RepID=UPI00085529CC|nr:hypothetical protein [Hydrogenophaga sp. RAC07]AOF87694.1 hypothetical protein BSY239_1549 [Hydrogenophaga sp. RAC07]
MQVRCRCQRPLELALHVFEDGVAVFDERDGSLHALNPIAGEALGHLICNTALSDLELLRLILVEEPIESELEQVRVLLNELVSLGFAEYTTT